MKVLFATARDRHGGLARGQAEEILRKFAAARSYTRLSLGGRTHLGRAGVALDMAKSTVTGHKMEPICPELAKSAKPFFLFKADDAAAMAADGHDVLIGTLEQGCLLRWEDGQLAVYANGDDSYH